MYTISNDTPRYAGRLLYTTKVLLGKISPVAHNLYWDKNFANLMRHPLGSSGWINRYIHCSALKNSPKNICQIHALAKSVKIFVYMVLGSWGWAQGTVSLGMGVVPIVAIGTVCSICPVSLSPSSYEPRDKSDSNTQSASSNTTFHHSLQHWHDLA